MGVGDKVAVGVALGRGVIVAVGLGVWVGVGVQAAAVAVIAVAVMAACCTGEAPHALRTSKTPSNKTVGFICILLRKILVKISWQFLGNL